MKQRVLYPILALSISAVALAQPAEKKAAPAPPKAVLAMIGDRPVTDAESEERAGERLARIKAEEYTVKRQAVDEYILPALMEKGA